MMKVKRRISILALLTTQKMIELVSILTKSINTFYLFVKDHLLMSYLPLFRICFLIMYEFNDNFFLFKDISPSIFLKYIEI